jgi:putative salt-induced outer membrane protein
MKTLSLKHSLAAASVLLAFSGTASAQATVKEDGEWRAALGAAFSKSSGNTDSTSLALQGDAVRATAQDKWTIYGNALYGKTAGAKTADQQRAGTRYDWNLTPRLFWFGGLDAERDKIALLNSRFTVSTGVGYKIFKEPNLTWDVFGGAGYVTDDYAAARLVDGGLRTSYDYATLLLGQESTHKFTPTTSAKQRLVVYPNLSNSGEYRAQWDFGLAVAMSARLNLTAGLAYKYNSDPGVGIKKTDTLFTTGVAMKFE